MASAKMASAKMASAKVASAKVASANMASASATPSSHWTSFGCIRNFITKQLSTFHVIQLMITLRAEPL